MKTDLTGLNKDVEKVFKKYGIKSPAMLVVFTCEQTGHNTVHWVSNTSRNDSIKLLDGLSARMKSQLN